MGGKAVRPVLVVQTSKTQDQDAKEPLDERETFTEFETYLVKKNLSPEAQRARRMDFSSVRRAPESLENAGEYHHEDRLELTPVEEDGPEEIMFAQGNISTWLSPRLSLQIDREHWPLFYERNDSPALVITTLGSFARLSSLKLFCTESAPGRRSKVRVLPT